jgi:competence protein ComEC
MSEVTEGLGVRTADVRPGLPSPFLSQPARPAISTSLAKALDGRRLFVLLPFAVILGMIASLLPEEAPPPEALVGVGLVLAIALLLARGSQAAWRSVVLGSAFWAGVALLELYGALFGTTMLARPAYGTFEARVDEVLSEGETGRRVVISGIQPVTNARAVPMRRARVVIGGDVPLAPGDGIRGPIRFYPVPGPVVPGGYDTQFHSYFDGIGAYGTATGAVEVVTTGAAGAERAIDAVRRAMAQRIDARITGQANGIARSMMIGDQSRITDEVREVMAGSGLAHIYSISGLHLSIVALGVLQALRYLLVLVPGVSRYVSIKKVAAVVALTAAFGYLLLAGGSSNVPAFRSTLMIALVLGAVLAGRRALTMRNVAIAALIIIATDPASVFRPSFQLSFAAVVALIGSYEWARSDPDRSHGAVAWVWKAVLATALTSLIAGLATLLFSAYHFQQTAPLGLIGNLMALILIMPIMVSIVISALVMPLGLEGPFLLALQVLLDMLIWIAALVSAWSAGLTLHPLLTPLSLIFGLVALGWFAFFQGRYRLIGPALLVPAVLLLAMDRPPDVLVADTTRAVALRGADGLALIDGKSQSFAVEVWRDTYGEPIGPGTAKCDSIACLAEGPGFSVAIVDDPAGFYEECATADLVITRRDAPATCAASVVIDADTLASGGVHWLRWTGDTFEIRAAKTGLSRPWRAALR